MHNFMCMHISDFLIGPGKFSCLLYALLKTVIKYYYYEKNQLNKNYAKGL